jgi:hypothetical protein
MGGHRRPRADLERMLGKPGAADRIEFGNAWRALAAEFGVPPAREPCPPSHDAYCGPLGVAGGL